MQRRGRTLTLFFCIALMVTACAASTASATFPPPTATIQASPMRSATPRSTLTSTLTPLPAVTAAPEARGLIATFTNGGNGITLNQDGTWSIEHGGQPENHGTFIVQEDHISLIDVDDRPDSCPPAQEPGVYSWVLKGKTLNFSAVNDACAPRVDFLVTGSWSKP